ncbi:hypothetical protein GCM10011428_02320 [Streptomyces violaceus]
MGASALVGVTTVVAPLAGPLAARLVPKERLGVTGGTLLSGSLAGMLLSRTVGGALGDRLGWRAPYVLAAVLSLAVAALSARLLPRTTPPSAQRYPALLAEPLRLLRTEPGLRRSCLYQALVFAGFSAVWTGVAPLLTGPAYGMGAGAVGLLALVNAVTMVCTPVAGRQVDRRGPDAVNRCASWWWAPRPRCWRWAVSAVRWGWRPWSWARCCSMSACSPGWWPTRCGSRRCGPRCAAGSPPRT